MRYLFYSHDGLGLGHTRRHLAIAGALTRLAPESSALLASGADDALRMGLPPGVEILKLPGLRKVSNDSYYSRRLRIPETEIRAMRSALLLTTVKSFRPHVVLVDKHPFGVNGEFRDALSAARGGGCRAVLGLRDILDDPATVLREWAPHNLQAEISENFDSMFVYGEQSVFDPLVEYHFPASMSERTRFCGYVVNHEAHEPRGFAKALNWEEWPRPLVLATTGGGEDGFRLLETFIHAAADAPWQGMVVTGPMTPPDELKRLRKLADSNDVPLEMFVPNLSAAFSSVDALVCMGGYNTLAEAVSQGVPTVCVPRMFPRAEQVIRAEAMAQLGLVRIAKPDALDSNTLGDAIAAVVETPRQELLARARANLSFDGAAQAASHLLALATEAAALAVAS
jgi:predicted glycosyltransferase